MSLLDKFLKKKKRAHSYDQVKESEEKVVSIVRHAPVSSAPWNNNVMRDAIEVKTTRLSESFIDQKSTVVRKPLENTRPKVPPCILKINSMPIAHELLNDNTVKFIGYSKIDGYPIFSIEDQSVDRIVRNYPCEEIRSLKTYTV